MIRRAVLFLLLLAAGCGDEPRGGGVSGPAETATDLIAADRVLLIAHRGASGTTPENTIAAFQKAQAASVDLIELDYRHTKEGLPIVIHDETLDRTTDAVSRWGTRGNAVEARTWAEIQRLDAGSWFDARFKGARVPTLGHAVQTIEREALPLIERKSGDAGTLVQYLKRTERERAVVVQAFDWSFLEACRGRAPDLALVALGKGDAATTDLDRIAGFGAAAVGWRASDLDEALVKRFHDRGLKVWAYTVNDVEAARRLIAAGVDGIITDLPETIGAVLD